MENNEYSQRTKKDAVVDNDYTTETSNDTELENFITKHQDECRKLTILKTAILIVTAATMITGLCMASVAIFGISVVVGVILMFTITENKYKKLLSQLTESFFKDIKYNTWHVTANNQWETMLDFNSYFYVARISEEDETIIESNGMKTNVFEFDIIKGHRHVKVLFSGEYYLTCPNKAYANGIMIVSGLKDHVRKPPVALDNIYLPDNAQLYAESQEDANTSDIDRAVNLVCRLHQYLSGKQFLLYFAEDNVFLIIKLKDTKRFNYNLFDFNVTKSIRRDFTALQQRMDVSKIIMEG